MKMQKSRIVLIILATVGLSIGAWLVFYRFPGHHVDTVSRIDLELNGLAGALLDYKKQFGTYPSGDSRAICKALSGVNSSNTIFIALGRGRITPDGDILDPWGTPYKIYISGEWVFIRSAGRNGQFETPNEKGSDDCFYG